MTSATERLTVQISGTHFLFVGAEGARKAAQAITDLVERSDTVRRDIAAALG
jgi:cell division GTPase FtsZ